MPYEGTAATSWTADELSDDSREAFFKAAVARQTSSERDAASIRKLGMIFGASGLLVGVLGISAGLMVYVKTPIPEPPGYILVNSTTGAIEAPVKAKDAPRLFTESVRQRAMRDFIIACESYIPATWARLDYHACMLYATPDEQKRQAADIGINGPHYPVTIFGQAGWAMPTSFLSFVNLGEVGKEPNQTFHYEVRYERTEVENGKETRPRYTAHVHFQFHPELKIDKADRLINHTGFQALSFSTVRDGTP